jgi:FtsZ-binding cell division protein ZapB
MKNAALLQVETKKLEDIRLLQIENSALKQRLNVLVEENNNLKREKIAFERRSQEMTDGLESLLKNLLVKSINFEKHE